jgi:hypothetical protein
VTGCGATPVAGVETPAATTPKAPAPKAAAKAAPREALAYAEAASENARLADDIEWSFGGRTQHGWALYADLIGHLVGTDAEASTPEYALAVAKWEKRNGIAPADGRVTKDVWLRMMRELQSQRTFDAAPCPSSELCDPDVAEWFDRSRAPELRRLRRDAYDAYTRMVAAARADLGPAAKGYFTIISGYRSPEYQAALRAKAGNPSTASLAIHSPHFTGRAIDMYVGGEPVSTADANRRIQVATPAYRWLAHNAHRFGFRPYFYEPWHWEYDPRLAARS